MHHFVFGFTICLLLLGCGDIKTMQEDSVIVTNKVMQSKDTPSGVPFTGRVVRIELEGGFWAIITDEGKKLDCAVPQSLRFHNQKVTGAYQVNPDIASFRMWGEVVKLHSLKPLGPIIKSYKNQY